MIFGLTPRHVPPENWTPLEAVTVIKCLDEEGDMSLFLTSTPGLTGWERIGMLTASLDTSRACLQDAFEADEDDGE